jgi:cation diffusion facilitator family transporter
MDRLGDEASAQEPNSQRTTHESARRVNTVAILSPNEVLVTTNDSAPDASARTVMVAFVANLGVAFAKLVAAIVTRSTAMSAEAAHAFADSGNQVLLLVAQRRSTRGPDERHPFGHGREAYFWALIASVVVFVAGAVFSAREGISELVRPVEASSFIVAYAVLAISLLLDGVSLRQAVRQLRGEALMFRRDVLDQVMLTSDPTVRAVFAEDAAAIVGDLIALVGVGLHQASGSSIPDSLAALLIGLLLIGVGIQLARRNRDFLLGEQASPPAVEKVRSFLVDYPGVVAVRELLVTFVGPRRLWVLARLDIDDDLRGNDVEALARAVETGLKQESEYIARVDVVPIGSESDHVD